MLLAKIYVVRNQAYCQQNFNHFHCYKTNIIQKVKLFIFFDLGMFSRKLKQNQSEFSRMTMYIIRCYEVFSVGWWCSGTMHVQNKIRQTARFPAGGHIDSSRNNILQINQQLQENIYSWSYRFYLSWVKWHHRGDTRNISVKPVLSYSSMCVCVCLDMWVRLHEHWINIVYLFGMRVFSLDCWDGQWPVFLRAAKIDSHSGQPFNLGYLQNTHTAYVYCCQGYLCAHIQTKIYENAPLNIKL